MNIKNLLIVVFALLIFPQIFGDLTIKYSIYYINNTTYEGALTTPYNFSIDVWIDNTKDNPVIKYTPYAKFVVWVEKDPNYANEYKIWTNATTNNPPYLKIWYNATLYDENGTLLNSANGLYGDADGEGSIVCVLLWAHMLFHPPVDSECPGYPAHRGRVPRTLTGILSPSTSPSSSTSLGG